MKLIDFPVRKWELKPEYIQMRGKYIHNGFSNMTLVNIKGVNDGITYCSVENYYQAHKVLDIALRQEVAQINPYEAKRWAKTIVPHKDWNDGLGVMYEALYLKWKQPNWVPKLNSLPNEIVEWNNWRDSKWGVHISLPPVHSVVEGRNILGCMLMQIGIGEGYEEEDEGEVWTEYDEYISPTKWYPYDNFSNLVLCETLNNIFMSYITVLYHQDIQRKLIQGEKS